MASMLLNAEMNESEFAGPAFPLAAHACHALGRRQLATRSECLMHWMAHTHSNTAIHLLLTIMLSTNIAKAPKNK
jgi:hypothetical protein